MLSNAELVGFVGTRSPDAARTFYRDRLGLELVHEDDFALVFQTGGNSIRVTKVGEFTPLPFTVLGWNVEAFDETIAALVASGVSFERYPQLEQDERGVWGAPGGFRLVWFKDPDGNTLSVGAAP